MPRTKSEALEPPIALVNCSNSDLTTFDELMILAPGGAGEVSERREARSFGRMGGVLADAGLGMVHWVQPAVLAAGAHMEFVSEEQIGVLAREAAELVLGGAPSSLDWVDAPDRIPLRGDAFDPSLQRVAQVLTDLADPQQNRSHQCHKSRRPQYHLPQSLAPQTCHHYRLARTALQ